MFNGWFSEFLLKFWPEVWGAAPGVASPRPTDEQQEQWLALSAKVSVEMATKAIQKRGANEFSDLSPTQAGELLDSLCLYLGRTQAPAASPVAAH